MLNDVVPFSISRTVVNYMYMLIYMLVFYGTLSNIKIFNTLRKYHMLSYTLFTSILLWLPMLVIELTMAPDTGSIIYVLYEWFIQTLILIGITGVSSQMFDYIRRSKKTTIFTYKIQEIIVKTSMTFFVLSLTQDRLIWFL